MGAVRRLSRSSGCARTSRAAAAAAAVPALLNLVSESPGVEALTALAGIAPDRSEVRSALLAALDDRESLARAEASRARRDMGADAAFAIPSLEHCANDPESYVRSAARAALARIRR